MKPNFQNPFYIDLRSLALLRISIGLIILVDYISRLSELKIFYTDEGVLPRQVLLQEMWVLNFKWSLLLLTGNEILVSVFFAAGILLSVLLVLGYRVKWVVFFSWIVLISIQNRNPLVLNAGDTILHLMLFWCFFLPVGERLSMNKLKYEERMENSILSIPSYAIIIQIILVYFFSAIYKETSVWVQDGTALYYALNIDQVVTPAGKSLLAFPRLLKTLSAFTFYLELIGPFLLLIPVYTFAFRSLAIVLFFSFHFLTLLFFDLGVFSFIGMAIWLLFIPTEFWEKHSNTFFEKRFIRNFHYIDLIPGLIIIYVLLWNIRGFDYNSYKKYFPVKVNVLAQIFQTQQRWKLFAPLPITDDGRFVVEAEDSLGTTTDLLLKSESVYWANEINLPKRAQSKRWKKYFASLYKSPKYAPYFLNYLCKESFLNPGSKPLTKISMVYLREITPPPGQNPPPIQRIKLSHCDCQALRNH